MYVDLSSNVEVDKRWYRGGGMRASESHRVTFKGARIVATLSPLTTEPYLSGDAIRTAAAWAGIVDSAVQSALVQLKDDELRAHAAGRLVVAQQTIDRWFEYAATAEDLTQVAIPSGRPSPTPADGHDRGRGATGSRPFATGTALDRARRDFELFVLQHRLDPLVTRLGRQRIEQAQRG